MFGVGDGLAASALDLLLPRSCAGCANPGARVCDACLVDLADLRLSRSAGRAVQVRPDPCPDPWPPCYAWGRYEGVSARLLRAAKDGGRRDVLSLLAVLLAHSLAAALAGAGGEALVIPAPSAPRTRRARGDHPVHTLGQQALRHLDVDRPLRDVLATARGVSDQARLGQAERWANLSEAVVVRPRFRSIVRGQRVVLIDDVVTSGATMAACARACRDAGAREVRAATVLAARRGHP